MRFFKIEEFDSPDSPGSGKMMEMAFVETLDEARSVAGIPFRITSGFRTVEWNKHLLEQGLPASRNSSHLLGLAADIAVKDSRSRFLIIDALLEVGITRIGVADSFVHCDVDPFKPQNVIWTY